MIAVDTNILVYAHRRDSPWHTQASTVIRDLASDAAPWGIALHCLVEFYGIVTHPKIYKTPSTPSKAADQIRAWTASPSLQILVEAFEIVESILDLCAKTKIVGSMAHDACVATLCHDYGIDWLLTADRDFSRFPGVKTKNPLVA